MEDFPCGAGGEARHSVPEILDVDVVDGVDELVFSTLLTALKRRNLRVDSSCSRFA